MIKFYLYLNSLLFCSLLIANEDYVARDLWINGAGFSSFTPSKNHTIYFSKWDSTVERLRLEKSHYIALQLTTNFDPLPYDTVSLPSLAGIASIASRDVRIRYLSFLEQFGRTCGFNYLILPDTSNLSLYEKEVLKEAHEKSPGFFIPNALLVHHRDESKKEYKALNAKGHRIRVVSEIKELKKLKKWSLKYLSREHRLFLDQLEKAKHCYFERIFSLPPALSQEMVRQGVYAIDANETLPLSATEVAYIGENDQLRTWLSKYAIVNDTRQPGLATIVDHLSNPELPTQPGDVVISNSYLVNQNVSQLIFPVDEPDKEVVISKLLFGAMDTHGRHEFAKKITSRKVLSFSKPSQEGMNNSFHQKIDSIGKMAINIFATPGMQVAIIKNGSMVYQRSFGHYTYDSIKPVTPETLYDLASLTKVLATLPAVALLIDKKLISLDDSISHHLPEFEKSNKSGITVRQLLAHNAGLKAYLPFWSMVMDNDRLNSFFYRNESDEANDIRTYGIDPDPVMLDTLKSYLVDSKLARNPEEYRYSDLGFMILHLLVEKVSGKPLNIFLEDEFYTPMGLTNTSFNPLHHGHHQSVIAPTENDERFRNGLVWGEVHDRNAMVFGGVSGHAGLFSNVGDLAKMMTMFLNEGFYGGRQYLSKEVLASFNQRHFKNNRRGLGWDKKEGLRGASSVYASDESFGHTGFTGTMVWADPKEELIFIFLSNRIYPDANNQRISKYNIRTLMHDSIYESLN